MSAPRIGRASMVSVHGVFACSTVQVQPTGQQLSYYGSLNKLNLSPPVLSAQSSTEAVGPVKTNRKPAIHIVTKGTVKCGCHPPARGHSFGENLKCNYCRADFNTRPREACRQAPLKKAGKNGNRGKSEPR